MLKTGIHLQEGTNLKRCYEDKECGEILDGTQIFRLLTQCSSRKYYYMCGLGGKLET